LKNKKVFQGDNIGGVFSLFKEFLRQSTLKGDLDVEKFIRPSFGKLNINVSTLETTNTLKRYYHFTQFGSRVPTNLLDEIQYVVRRECPWVTVKFKLKMKPFEINWQSKKVSSRITTWKLRYDSAMAREQQESKSDKLELDTDAISKRDKNKHMIDSYSYLKNNRKNKLFKTHIIMELTVDLFSEEANFPKESTKKFQYIMQKLIDLEERISDELAVDSIKMKRVSYYLVDFLNFYLPTSMKENSLISRVLHPQILTKNEIQQLITYEQGVVGDETGAYLGNDVETNLPVFLDIFEKGKAGNIILAAVTGGGKSLFLKFFSFFCKLHKATILILDYEGDEYTAYGKYVDAKEISLSGDDSPYVDASQIGELTGDERIDTGLFSDAKRITELIFNGLSSDLSLGKTMMSTTERKVFQDALNIMYIEHGVIENDSNTWENSRGENPCSYFEVYKGISNLIETKYQESERLKELETFRDALSFYFEKDGLYSSLFNIPIDIDELDDDFIIFKFGNQGASQITSLPHILEIKQIMISHLRSLIANRNRAKGKITISITEEGQRYLESRGAAEAMANEFTGARKRLVKNIFITNSPRKLVEAGKNLDKTASQDSRYYSDIKSNTTQVIIGDINRSAAEAICKEFEMLDGLEDLRKIRVGENEYGFLTRLNKNDYVVTKMEASKELIEHPIFSSNS